MPIYMKYEGIEGEVTGRYKGWIKLDSCQLGTRGGTRSNSEIVATKTQDCTSAHLFRESLNPSGGKKVTIDFVNGNEAPYLSVELENTLISSFTSSGSGSDRNPRPHESFSLNSTKISYSTKPTASAKKPKGPMWDLVIGSP